MRDLVQGIAQANGAEAEFVFDRGYPSVVNDPAAAARAALAGAKLLGEDKVIHQRLPGMGGEDFAYMAQKVPGCFVRIGQADGEQRQPAGAHRGLRLQRRHPAHRRLAVGHPRRAGAAPPTER